MSEFKVGEVAIILKSYSGREGQRIAILTEASPHFIRRHADGSDERGTFHLTRCEDGYVTLTAPQDMRKLERCDCGVRA